ncbi:ATP-binding protein [Streptomyces sp. NPDC088732]|uniref:ATP-binding protein n=1 Tax=Streptomyces sp. NPDC088732 TaxID=3365879 RepID=UPI00380F1535
MTAAIDDMPIPKAREPKPLVELTDRVLDALRRGGADLSQLGVPAQQEPEDGLWEDVSVPQARARKNIWINSMREAAQDEYLRFRLDDLDPNQKPNTLRAWMGSLVEAKKRRARPEVLNMIVPGNIGTGKTTALAALGNEASETGLLVRFVKHSTYLSYFRSDGRPDNISAYRVRKDHVEADLLILDELGGEMDAFATPFVREKTSELIDARLGAGRATALSTNLRSRRTPEHPGMGVVDILGERLLSRLESRAHLVKITGPDRRKPAKPLDW